MSVGAYLAIYCASLLTLLGLDLVWLGVVARGFYRAQLGPLMRPDVQWGPAVLFYLLFVAGILVFATVPALERGQLGRALGTGAFFGLVAYATYDLTNLAVLRGFPPLMAIVDMAWGAVLAAIVAGVGYAAGRMV